MTDKRWVYDKNEPCIFVEDMLTFKMACSFNMRCEWLCLTNANKISLRFRPTWTERYLVFNYRSHVLLNKKIWISRLIKETLIYTVSYFHSLGHITWDANENLWPWSASDRAGYLNIFGELRLFRNNKLHPMYAISIHSNVKVGKKRTKLVHRNLEWL